MAVPVALAQRQTPGEDWVVVGRGHQEEAADDEQQQKVRLGVLEVTADDQRPVRLPRVSFLRCVYLDLAECVFT